MEKSCVPCSTRYSPSVPGCVPRSRPSFAGQLIEKFSSHRQSIEFAQRIRGEPKLGRWWSRPILAPMVSTNGVRCSQKLEQKRRAICSSVSSGLQSASLRFSPNPPALPWPEPFGFADQFALLPHRNLHIRDNSPLRQLPVAADKPLVEPTVCHLPPTEHAVRHQRRRWL